MNKREARRDACRIVGLLISNYFDVGQPFTGCEEGRERTHKRVDAHTCPDCDRLHVELERIMLQMERRSE